MSDEHRIYAQRQHVVQSIDHVLHVLHVLSHLQSPSLWILLCRSTSQFQLVRPLQLNKQRTMRFWFLIVVLINFTPLIKHATMGSTDTSAMLDFVGSTSTPSKLRLIALDITILALQWFQVYVAYESYLARYDLGQPLDILLPPSISDLDSGPKPQDTEVIMDISFRQVVRRLRHPPPVNLSDEDVQSQPIVSPFSLANSDFTAFPRAPRPPRPPRSTRGTQRREREEAGRVPGGMDS